MRNTNKTEGVDVEKVKLWLLNLNPFHIAIRQPAYFTEMGFPERIVKQCVRMHSHVRLNNGEVINVSGVSDMHILMLLSWGIQADTSEEDECMSLTNKVLAWRNACLEKLDEIIEI